MSLQEKAKQVLPIELKATFVGVDEIMVPDWDGV